MTNQNYKLWQKYYKNTCPIFVDYKMGLYFDRYIIKKVLRRYYSSLYLPFNLEGKNIIILKKE